MLEIKIYIKNKDLRFKLLGNRLRFRGFLACLRTAPEITTRQHAAPGIGQRDDFAWRGPSTVGTPRAPAPCRSLSNAAATGGNRPGRTTSSRGRLRSRHSDRFVRQPRMFGISATIKRGGLLGQGDVHFHQNLSSCRDGSASIVDVGNREPRMQACQQGVHFRRDSGHLDFIWCNKPLLSPEVGTPAVME